MKKLTIVIALILISVSCSSSEQDYNRVFWKHKAKMLELEYIEKCVDIKRDINYQLNLIELDSLMNDF